MHKLVRLGARRLHLSETVLIYYSFEGSIYYVLNLNLKPVLHLKNSINNAKYMVQYGFIKNNRVSGRVVPRYYLDKLYVLLCFKFKFKATVSDSDFDKM